MANGAAAARLGDFRAIQPQENGYAGKLPWKGEGWYRKTFTLDKADSGRRVYFDFDGVMAFPKGLCERPIGRRVGLRLHVVPRRCHEICEVRRDQRRLRSQADTRRHGTRWYPGAGIYRKVTMTICEPVHVAHWGMYVTTPEVSDAVGDSPRASRPSKTTRQVNQKVTVEVMLLDPDGKTVANRRQERCSIPAGGSRDLEQSMNVDRAPAMGYHQPEAVHSQEPFHGLARSWIRTPHPSASGRFSSRLTTDFI